MMKAVEISKGKVVSSAAIKGDALYIAFTDGTGMALWDGGQSCCEARHMSTDDDLGHMAGATFFGIDIKAAPDLPGDDVHECEFLDILTDRGTFTMVNHNEHNGYYGGFDVVVKLNDHATFPPGL